jgi:hypothetical protein
LRKDRLRDVSAAILPQSFPAIKPTLNRYTSEGKSKESGDNEYDRCESSASKERIHKEEELRREDSISSLEWYRKFFNNRPLMRCLDTDDEEILAKSLFERLLEETRHTVDQDPSAWLNSSLDDPESLYDTWMEDDRCPGDAAGQSFPEPYRGELIARVWWNDVRAKLRMEDD